MFSNDIPNFPRWDTFFCLPSMFLNSLACGQGFWRAQGESWYTGCDVFGVACWLRSASEVYVCIFSYLCSILLHNVRSYRFFLVWGHVVFPAWTNFHFTRCATLLPDGRMVPFSVAWLTCAVCVSAYRGFEFSLVISRISSFLLHFSLGEHHGGLMAFSVN